MSRSNSGSFHEKTQEASVPDQKPAKKNGFFSRRKQDENTKADVKDEKSTDDDTEVDVGAPVSPALQPANFTDMFRYV